MTRLLSEYMAIDQSPASLEHPKTTSLVFLDFPALFQPPLFWGNLSFLGFSVLICRLSPSGPYSYPSFLIVMKCTFHHMYRLNHF